MNRKNFEIKQTWLSALTQAVGSVCALLLALGLALSLTLLKEGHFAECIEKSGYIDTVHQSVVATCSNYAAQLGITDEPLRNTITREAVRAGILHRADTLWYGATTDLTDPFGNIITIYQDTVAADPPVYDGYRILQYNCQMEWKSAMATPFSSAVSLVLQYRGTVSLMVYASALLLLGCMLLQFLLADEWGTLAYALLRIADSCLMAGMMLAVWIAFGSGYQNWVSEKDVGYLLFCRWFGAFPVAIAACAAAVALALNLLVCGIYHQKLRRKVK